MIPYLKGPKDFIKTLPDLINTFGKAVAYNQIKKFLHIKGINTITRMKRQSTQ
jgi:hypothetical protein